MDLHNEVPTLLSLAGVAVFLTGAGVATTVGVWGTGPGETLANVLEAPNAWTVGNALLAAGAVLTAAGLATMAPTGPVGRIGATLWIAAGTLGAVGFLMQGYGTHAMAEVWQATGQVPEGYSIIRSIDGALIGSFEAFAYIGCAGLALAAVDAGATRLFGYGIAGASILLTVFLLARFDAFPAAAEFVAVAVVILLRTGKGAHPD